MNARFGMIAAALALSSSVALACGVCIDDKVAAAYDHDTVQRAVHAGKQVVYVELSGPLEVHALAPRARRAMQALPAIDQSTVRTSDDIPVISFAVDPARQSPDAAVAALRQRLEADRIVPTLLKILPTAGL